MNIDATWRTSLTNNLADDREPAGRRRQLKGMPERQRVYEVVRQ